MLYKALSQVPPHTSLVCHVALCAHCYHQLLNKVDQGTLKTQPRCFSEKAGRENTPPPLGVL